MSENLSAHQTRAMQEISERLCASEGPIDPQRRRIIERWMREAAAQFTGARVQGYVPILVERIVRRRMIATP